MYSSAAEWSTSNDIFKNLSEIFVLYFFLLSDMHILDAFDLIKKFKTKQNKEALP